MSLGNLLYVSSFHPYTIYLDNIFEICNEATILIVLTSSVRFADRDPSPEAASNLGFALIGIISLNIAVNLGYFLYENGKLIFTKLKDIIEKLK